MAAKLKKFNNNVDKDYKSKEEALRAGKRLVKDIKNEKRYFLQDLKRKFIISPILDKADKVIDNQ